MDDVVAPPGRRRISALVTIVVLALIPLSCSDGSSTSKFERSYSSSWGMGSEVIELASDERYQRLSMGCMGGTTTEGRYEERDGVLVFARPDGEFSADPYPPEYPIELESISWGGRRFLLREAQFLAFCQLINEGA